MSNLSDILLGQNLGKLGNIIYLLLNVNIDFVKSSMIKEIEAAKRGLGPGEMKALNEFFAALAEAQKKVVILEETGKELWSKASKAPMN